MDMGHLARDGQILRSEFVEGALPALVLRPLLTNLGIRVIATTATGIATACPTTRTITVGGPDKIANCGPYTSCVREYTSALAWGFARIRLAALNAEAQAHSYAAAFLCPVTILQLAPELSQRVARAREVEALARRLAVASWVVAEAIRGYGLVDRVLLDTKKGKHDGGTICAKENQS